MAITEGLLICLTECACGELAGELSRYGLATWVLDIASAGLLAMLQQQGESQRDAADAPLWRSIALSSLISNKSDFFFPEVMPCALGHNASGYGDGGKGSKRPWRLKICFGVVCITGSTVDEVTASAIANKELELVSSRRDRSNYNLVRAFTG